MIAEFDRLVEIGDDDAADKLGERLMCPRAPAREQAEKERLDGELQELIDSGAATRTMEEIQATLKECRGGCVHYVKHVCLKRGSNCTHRKRWIECLIFTGCEKVVA
jgi:hypothetical protein